MSQHTFKHSNLNVLCGWDRPLQGYFLVISDDNLDEPCYSNLYEKIPHPKLFDDFLLVLARFKLPLPLGLIEALEEDKINDTGNKLTEW